MKKKHQQVRVASEQILPMRARRQILGNTISNSFKVFRNFRVRLKKTILITKNNCTLRLWKQNIFIILVYVLCFETLSLTQKKKL
jgi:hypothetical protein